MIFPGPKFEHPVFDEELDRTKVDLCFSGGQDSTTCLLWLLRLGVKAENIILHHFRYGQRHAREEEHSLCAVAERAGLAAHQIVVHGLPIPMNSALVHPMVPVDGPHPSNHQLPASFVPGRNLQFILTAAEYMYEAKRNILVLGVNAVDYSGYPDCRPGAIAAMSDAVRQGFDWPEFTILAPLMEKSKADIVRTAQASSPFWKEFMAMAHTCYEGVFPGCTHCPACKIRAAAFEEVGVPDPRFEVICGQE